MQEIIVKQSNQIDFSQDKIDLIKKTVADGATDMELQLFVEQCKRTQLDPILKQIYFIKDNKGKVNIMTSIDGLRLIAERSGVYEGQTHQEWCGQDGVWKTAWLDSEPPKAARVGVYKKNFREALTAVALYSEYAQVYNGKPNYIWGSKPALMLSKVAEALALRKAFPNDMSGIYTTDEYQPEVEPKKTVTNISNITPPAPKPKPIEVIPAKHDEVAQEIPAEAFHAESVNSDFDSFQSTTNPGDYVCKVGKKYLGKKLSEIGKETVKEFQEYIINNNKEKNQKPVGDWAEFVIQAELYLKS